MLPAWYDTYDFAARVESLGVGMFGNRKAAPWVDGEELGNILLAKTDPKGEKHRSMGEKARELAAEMRKYGGRRVAAEKILELAELEGFRRESK